MKSWTVAACLLVAGCATSPKPPIDDLMTRQSIPMESAGDQTALDAAQQKATP